MTDHGEIDKAKGRVKQAGGDLTGDESLKREGETDEMRGTVKDKIQEAADILKGKK